MIVVVENPEVDQAGIEEETAVDSDPTSEIAETQEETVGEETVPSDQVGDDQTDPLAPEEGSNNQIETED